MTPITPRLEELARVFLKPLVCGGTVTLVAPFGAALASMVEGPYAIADHDVRVPIDVARVRRARLLYPVDTLPDLSREDWALAMALNDVFQVTNHHLSGAFTRGRHKKLLEAAARTIELVAPPRTIFEALARHALFGRVLSVFRTDTRLSWWTGSASFRGEPPSKRLMAWPEMRRVRVEPKQIAFAEMLDGVRFVEQDAFLATIALWLADSPITDLATCGRREPIFAWSKPTLQLVATREGCNLAQRALLREPEPAVRAALTRALSRLPQGTLAHGIAQIFTEATLERLAAERGSATRPRATEGKRGSTAA